MPFLERFPLTRVTLPGSSSPISLIDLTRSVRVRRKVLDQADALIDYRVRDGDTPQSIAYRVYDRADYDWVILMVNNIVHPVGDWPMDTRAFATYLANKYPGTSLFFDPTSTRQPGSSARSTPFNRFFGVGEDATVGGLPAGKILAMDHAIGRVDVASAPWAQRAMVLQSPSASATIERVVLVPHQSPSHFETQSGVVVDPVLMSGGTSPAKAYRASAVFPIPIGEDLISPISIEQSESRANEAKRPIRVLRREFVDALVRELPNLIR